MGVINPSAPEGKSVAYARPERERRFLLERPPEGDVVKTAEIADRYLLGTRLRVRRTVERTASGARTIYKLTQKIPRPDGGPGLITTIYIDPREWAALRSLPGTDVEKTRLSVPPYGVDVFRGPLQGLVLAEVEFGTDEEMVAFVPTIPVVVEVTTDGRFAGARLATATADEIAADLSAFGVRLR